MIKFSRKKIVVKTFIVFNRKTFTVLLSHHLTCSKLLKISKEYFYSLLKICKTMSSFVVYSNITYECGNYLTGMYIYVCFVPHIVLFSNCVAS